MKDLVSQNTDMSAAKPAMRSERAQQPERHRDTHRAHGKGTNLKRKDNERMPKKAAAAPKKAIAKAAPKKAAGATAKALSVVGATANAGLIKVDGVLLDTHLAGAGGAAVHEDYAYLGNQVDIKPGTALPIVLAASHSVSDSLSRHLQAPIPTSSTAARSS